MILPAVYPSRPFLAFEARLTALSCGHFSDGPALSVAPDRSGRAAVAGRSHSGGRHRCCNRVHSDPFCHISRKISRYSWVHRVSRFLEGTGFVIPYWGGSRASSSTKVPNRRSQIISTPP